MRSQNGLENSFYAAKVCARAEFLSVYDGVSGLRHSDGRLGPAERVDDVTVCSLGTSYRFDYDVKRAAASARSGIDTTVAMKFLITLERCESSCPQ